MVTKSAAASHPPYADMVKEALVTLKDRSGSSLAALKKFIGSKYKLPEGWEKKLSMFLKKMTVEGKLVKVKGSWKLGDALKKAPAKPKKKVAKKPVVKKATADKPKKRAATKAKPAKSAKKAKPAPKKPAAAKKATATKAAKPKKVLAAKKAGTTKRTAAKKTGKK